MSTLDELFDEAEKAQGGNAATLDDLFDEAEAEQKAATPSFMAKPGQIPGIPMAGAEPPPPNPSMGFPIMSPPPRQPMIRPMNAPGADAPLPPSEKPSYMDMLAPTARGHAPTPTQVPVPDGLGGYKAVTMDLQESHPFEGAMDLAATPVRAAGAALDPILPWDARGQNADGSQKSFTQAMANPEAGIAKPAREGIAESIKTAWEYASDEEKPALMRALAGLMGATAAAAFLGAATVEDPTFLGPLAAGSKTAAKLADKAGRGLQTLGKNQMYKKLKPGTRDEKKGFDVQGVFDQNLDKPEKPGLLPGGNIEDVLRNSDEVIKSASSEMKARIAQGADQGVRVDIPAEIDAAIAEIIASPNASKENQELVSFLPQWAERFKQKARNLTEDGSGHLDLMAAQFFKQNRGDEGAWHNIARKRGFHIPKNESQESQAAEIIYRHLNDVIDEQAPEGIRDLNRQISEAIPIRQAAAHRKIVEDRNNRISLTDMGSFLAFLQDPLSGAAIYGATKAAKSGRVASALYRLGEKLRTAKTSAEKTRYTAALKKLGVSDEEIEAGFDVMEASGGEKAFQTQDVRTQKPQVPRAPQEEVPLPPNAIPFRRGEPPAPVPAPRRNTLPQEQGDELPLDEYPGPQGPFRSFRDLKRDGSEAEQRASDRYRDMMDQMSGKDQPRVPPKLPKKPAPDEEGDGLLLNQEEEAPQAPKGIPLMRREDMKRTAPQGPAPKTGGRMTDEAKAKFGTTRNWKHGGFMTPDGDLLDFRGKGPTARGDTEFRGMDHEEILAITDPQRKLGRSFGLKQFIDEGNIRLSPESGKLQVTGPLTSAQKSGLIRWLQNFKEKGFGVEVGYGGLTRREESFSRNYPGGTSPQRLFDDLDAHFHGQKPKEQSDLQKFRSQEGDGPTLYQEEEREFLRGRLTTRQRDDGNWEVSDNDGVWGVVRSQEEAEIYIKELQERYGKKPDPSTKYDQNGQPLPPKPTFFSELRRSAGEIIKKAGGKMPPKDLLNSLIKGSKVKAEELKWTGLQSYLLERAKGADPKAKGPVTPEELQKYLDENEVEIQEERFGNIPKKDREEMQRQRDRLQARYDDLVNKRQETMGSESKERLQKQIDALGNKITQLGENLQSRGPVHPSYNLDNDLQTGKNPEDYGELVLTWKKNPETLKQMGGDPDQPDYRHGHWPVDNALAHVRYRTTKTPDGKKVLFLEEIQGDWGQAATKKGVRGQNRTDMEEVQKLKQERHEVLMKGGDGTAEKVAALDKRLKRIQTRLERQDYSTPPGPFIGDTVKWTQLAMKRMIRYAAEHGFDRIAWTTGEQQAKRWNLSQVVDEIQWVKKGDNYFLTPKRGGYEVRHPDLDLSKELSRDEAEEVIGEDMMRRIDEASAKGATSGDLTTNDFALGGTGHKVYYNKIVRNAVNEYTKKNWGVQVEDVPMELEKAPPPSPSMRRHTDTESPDGRFRVQESTTSREELGYDPEYWLEDHRGRRLDGPFESEEDALDSDAWPKIKDEDDYEVESRAPDEVKYDIEEQDGRWYIIDQEKDRELVTPKEQKDLFKHKDTRTRGARYEGASPYTDVRDEEFHAGFDSKKEAQESLTALREEEGVDQEQWYVVQKWDNRDSKGPFDTEDEAMEAMPERNDYEAASVEKDYGEDVTTYWVEDEDGNRVVDDHFEDEQDAINAMMEHWKENADEIDLETAQLPQGWKIIDAGGEEGGSTRYAVKDANGNGIANGATPKEAREKALKQEPKPVDKIPLTQPGIVITDKMKASVLEGQPLFQKEPKALASKGQIQKRRWRSVITFFEGKADATTWMHEHGHWLRSDILTPAQEAVALKWAKSLVWDKAAEEKFARGFERYLYNGVAPSRDLKPAMETLKQAFRRVYADAQGTSLAEDIPPEMKLLYDAILLNNRKIRNPGKVMRILKAMQRAGAAGRLMDQLREELKEPRKGG